MKTWIWILVGSLSPLAIPRQGEGLAPGETRVVELPQPRADGSVSLEKTLLQRRAVRSFKDEGVSLATLSQLVWAAQGVTRKMDAPPNWSWGTWPGGKRTAPSAGALYPLEVYVVVGKVDGLPPAIYKYKPPTHQLITVSSGDRREQLATAALGQRWIQGAPLVIVVGAVYKRTEVKYGERASRYVHIEAGHAVENVCLQAVALELGTTVVGAFKDEDVKKVVGMLEEEQPLLIVPVGRPAQ